MKTVLRSKVSIVLLICMMGASALRGQTLTVLHNFAGLPGDGASPVAPLIMDAAGNFYGTTSLGGPGPCTDKITGAVIGCGTVFKLDPSGNETVLYRFSGPDGAFPAGGVLRDGAGNLYGTTVNGGSVGFCRNFGCGVVFKLDPAGNETVLHGFTGGTDGGNPTAGLIMDSANNLYGTTGFGGNFGTGTVFKVDPVGNETVLHSFTNITGTDGIEPSAPLIMDAAGNLYSTTFRGGSGGAGTVFKVDPRLDPSVNLTVLHAFVLGTDGGGSGAGVVMDATNSLYGTTGTGGAGGGGTLFKLDSSGNFRVLHAFTGGVDGGNAAIEGRPAAGVIIDTAGNLFGTTLLGGAKSSGTIFEFSSTLATLYSFCSQANCADGGNPSAGLVEASGTFYGTAAAGGTNRSGTVFKFQNGPAAIPVFVDIKPQSCPNPINVGANGTLAVAILGTLSFDVTTIDPSSVKLQGVSPVRFALEDAATPFTGALADANTCTTAGPDGFTDLVLLFGNQALSAALGSVTNGQVLKLTLSGNLKPQFGGTPITGQDVVVIKQ